MYNNSDVKADNGPSAIVFGSLKMGGFSLGTVSYCNYNTRWCFSKSVIKKDIHKH